MSDQASEELKPCPFCGGEALILSDWRGESIGCDEENCEINPRTESQDSLSDAMRAWNRRAGKGDGG